MLTPMFDDVLRDTILDGRRVAARVKDQVAAQVRELHSMGYTLKLALIRVGDDPASKVYVGHKVKACAQVGIESDCTILPEDISEQALLEKIAAVNADESVDGLLVQLPLPGHINEQRVIEAVDPRKDVDGFHPLNLGLLLGKVPLLEACTPKGVMTLLAAAGCVTRGANAVVVGRSVIVGRPMAQMLMRADATVTVCHRYTKDLEEHVRRADILVVATGVPGLIPGDWIKKGAVVCDVGINRMPDGKLRGDVSFDVARTRAAAITPVPGGVGPMTVAMLLWNTVLAARFRRQLDTESGSGPLTPFG